MINLESISTCTKYINKSEFNFFINNKLKTKTCSKCNCESLRDALIIISNRGKFSYKN